MTMGVETVEKQAAVVPPRRRDERRWTWQHYATVVAFGFLFWEGWTIVAWLSAGPHEITQYRDRHAAAWTAARIYEPVLVLISIGLLVYVIRGCWRQRRLTFDAMLVIAGLLMTWLDPFEMFFQPVFLYSSNWTNLNAWCGYAPGVVNPDCSRIPEPIIFIPLVYTFGVLACAIIGGWVIRRIRARYPMVSVGSTFAAVAAFGIVFDFAVEYPMMALHLWNYPGFPNSLSLFSAGMKYPLAIPIAAAPFWGGFAMVRNWKNDRGQTVFERGLERVRSPRQRTALTLFSVIAFAQVVLLAADWECAAWGPYSSPYRGLPAHVVNAVCDTAGFVHTRYGPCPGEPGYRMPVRHLPGPTP